MRTVKSCGPDTPTLVSSLRKVTFAGDGGQKARFAGESTKETVKTIAQGRPGRSGEPVVTTLVWLFSFPTRGCGCIMRPAFPAPFSGARRQESGKTRAKTCGGIVDARPVIARSALSAVARRAKADATTQSILSFRGEMDCFAFARNDGVRLFEICIRANQLLAVRGARSFTRLMV